MSEPEAVLRRVAELADWFRGLHREHPVSGHDERAAALRAVLFLAEERGREIERLKAELAAEREGVKRYSGKWRDSEARLAEVVEAADDAYKYLHSPGFGPDTPKLPLVKVMANLRAALAAAQPKGGIEQDFNGEFLPAQPKEEPYILDSPDFVPKELKDFEARGFKRINRAAQPKEEGR